MNDSDRLGSLKHMPAWIDGAILAKRMEQWPLGLRVAWLAGILRARGETQLAEMYAYGARMEWMRAACATPHTVLWNNLGEA